MRGDLMPFYAWDDMDFGGPIFISFVGPAALIIGIIIVLIASRKVAMIASIIVALVMFYSSRGFFENSWLFIPLGIVFLVVGAVMCKHEYDDIKNKADNQQTRDDENERGEGE